MPEPIPRPPRASCGFRYVESRIFTEWNFNPKAVSQFDEHLIPIKIISEAVAEVSVLFFVECGI
jgi:hypothetical protein